MKESLNPRDAKVKKARAATEKAIRAMAFAYKVSGSADLHEEAAQAHLRAAAMWDQVGAKDIARQHTRAAETERNLAASITALKQERGS